MSKRTAKQTGIPVSLSEITPDRVIIQDETFITMVKGEFEESMINEPDDSSLMPWIALNKFHRFDKFISSWAWESRPRWIQELQEESKWASKAGWNGEKVAWAFGAKSAVINAPYTLSMTDMLSEFSSPYRHSALLKGWIIADTEVDAELLTALLREYDIARSPLLGSRLEGRGTWKEILKKIEDEAIDEGFEVPGDIKSGRSYKDHQKSSILAMAYRGSNLLADQVGLGKGGQFISGAICLDNYYLSTAMKVAAAAKEAPETAYPVVISVPKSMKEEIGEEIHRWKHDAVVEIIEGTKPAPIGDETTQFIILNHDILAKRLPDLKDAGVKSFIADECHSFKNPDALRTKAALELANFLRKQSEFPYITMASGTPFLNSPNELWSILCILGKEEIFGEYALKKLGYSTMKQRTKTGWRDLPISHKRAFEIRWCAGHYNEYKDWLAFGSSHTNELNAMLIEHVMIRRRKSDVMHPLPELFEKLNICDVTGAERAEYDRIQDEFKDYVIEKAREKAAEEGTDPNYAVRVALFSLMENKDIMQMTALRQELAKMKLQYTVDWIHRFMAGDPDIIGDDPDRKKLIVYAHHRDPLFKLVHHEDLQQYGLVTVLSGSDQTGASIQEHKNLFQTDPNTRLIVMSMAAREGHTLTAAKDVYLHEIPFVPSWIVQMAGRCWARLSEQFEPHEATVHYSVVMNTLDAVLVRTNKIKKTTFNAVIDGEGQDTDIEDMRAESAEAIMDMLAIGKRELAIAG